METSLVPVSPLQPFQFFPFDLLAGTFLILICGVWIVFLLIAIWVYRDAESRGMGGVLWLLVVLLTGIIGLIIYLVVRSDRPEYPRPYGAPVYAPPAYGYPPQGPAPPPTATATSATNCPRCGAPLAPGARFCAACGSPL